MSTAENPDDVVPGPIRPRRATAAAGTALTALLLMGPGLFPAAASTAVAAPAPEPDGPDGNGAEELEPAVADRLSGVAEDLVKAVGYGQVTPEQAAVFLRKLAARLAN